MVEAAAVHGPWNIYLNQARGAKLEQIRHGNEPFFWTPVSPDTPLWCSGGERTWIAPEFGVHGFFTDPMDGSWRVPESLDPGDYRHLKQGGHHEAEWNPVFVNRLSLRSLDGHHFMLLMTRSLRILSADEQTITAGIESTLENRSDSTFPFPVGLWEILQLPASETGECLFPGVRKNEIRQCQGNTTPPSLLRDDGCIALPSLAVEEIKAGIAAGSTDGSTLYIDRRSGHRISFRTAEPPDPRRSYADRPGRPDSETGDAVQWYSTGKGASDPFCELELHSPAAVLEPGRSIRFGVELSCTKTDTEEAEPY